MKLRDVPLVIAAAACCAFCQPDSGNIVHTGQATYYSATGDGACMFGPSPGDLMVCAMNAAEYDTAAVCGASIHIVGPSGEVTVRVVDLCPECPRGNVDLSKQAFAKIADTILGRVSITWRYVETSVSGPIDYRIKTGSNPWWIGIQILNHRNPVARLEADSAGKWITVPRMSYNYFVDSSGLGPGPYSFRVTDLYGQQLTDANIPLAPDAITPGAANFASHAATVRQGIASHDLRGSIHMILRAVMGRGRLLGPTEKGPFDVYRIDGAFVGHVTNSVGGENRIAVGVYLLKPAGGTNQGEQ